MYSKEHLLYLKKIKRNKLLVTLTRIALLLFIIGIWEFLANKEIINPFISSSPSRIFKAIIKLIKSNNLWKHISITLYETILSFLLGEALGILISIILWWNNFLYKVFDPYLTVLNSLPKVALGPIIIIFFGANMNSIIIMALLISLIVTILTVYNGFSKTDINKINLLNSFNATKYQILKYVIIPNSYYAIISSLKINISMSLIGVIMGEFLVSKKGIGYLIMYGSQVFNLDLVMAGIIILLIVSIIMYKTVSYIEKLLVKNN